MADYFERLTEGCISGILLRTSPRDVCRVSTISWGFKSASESDTVWDHFLPSDLPAIMARAVSPVVYSTKKELYFRLFDSPVLLDGGTMIIPMALTIPQKALIRFAGDREDWAEEETSTVYLKSPPVGRVPDRQRSGYRVRQGTPESGRLPQKRMDGWMEIELGEFHNGEDNVEVEMRLMKIKHLNWKIGLIVEGIELRPK